MHPIIEAKIKESYLLKKSNLNIIFPFLKIITAINNKYAKRLGIPVVTLFVKIHYVSYLLNI